MSWMTTLQLALLLFWTAVLAMAVKKADGNF